MTATITALQSASAHTQRGLDSGEQTPAGETEAAECWRCGYRFADSDLVDLDGAPHCGPCARIETGDDSLADRVRDL